MEKRLQNSATDGDVEALYSILAEDPHVLERIDEIPFVDTPLHMAASAGKIHFAKEIVNLKPSFAMKRDHLGRSPIHLALESGHEELVTWFITIDSEFVRVKAKGMVTPLHYAAEIDDDFNLAYFLYVCPSSIKDLTVKSETAVHVALKNRSFRAFKVLLGWLRQFDKEDILSWQDEDGNTALHIATSTNQPEVIKLLLGYIEVNTKNKGGLTALDIFHGQQDLMDAKVGETLLHSKAKRASELDPSPTKSNTLVDYFSGELSYKEKILKIVGINGISINKLPLEVRNVVLVVAILIATATYQAALSPPGGYWQDDGNNPSASNTVSTTTTNTTTTNNSTGKGESQHRAGQMIIGSSLLYFFGLNSAAFYSSVCTILTIIVGLRFSNILSQSTYWLLLAYPSALVQTFPSNDYWTTVVIWVILITSAIATYAIPTILFSKEKRLRNYGRQLKLRRGVFE